MALQTKSYRYLSLQIAAAGLAISASGTFAADLRLANSVVMQPSGTALICNDGHSYRLQARALSDDGDLVTGYLLHDRNGARHYLRLVPMGIGYRYAGTGVWLDGHHEPAVLNFGFSRSAECEISQL